MEDLGYNTMVLSQSVLSTIGNENSLSLLFDLKTDSDVFFPPSKPIMIGYHCRFLNTP